MTKEELLTKGVKIHSIDRGYWGISHFEDIRIVRDPTTVRNVLLGVKHKPFPPKISPSFPYGGLIVVDGPVVYLHPHLYLGPDQEVYVIFTYEKLKRMVEFKGRKISYLTVSGSRVNSYKYGYGCAFLNLTSFARARFSNKRDRQNHVAGVINSNFEHEMNTVKKAFEKKHWIESGISKPIQISTIKNVHTFKNFMLREIVKGDIIKELFNGQV